jgi:hypothetical protein
MTASILATPLLASLSVAAALLIPAAASAQPGLEVSGPMGVPTEEGDAAPFTVSLAAPPSSDVTVVATTSLPGSVVIIPSQATFTAGNWMVPQTFWAMGVDDEIADGDEPVTIEVAVAAGSDPAYEVLPPELRDTAILDDEVTLTIESGPSLCIGPATEDVHDGSMVLTRYDREHPDAQGLWFDPANEEQDDLVVPEHSDERFVALRTLHVVLRNTLENSMTDAEVESLGQQYATAAHHIHVATGGMLMLDYDQLVVDEWFGEWAFGEPGTPDEGSFTAYHALEWEIMLGGYDIDDFDIINVTVGVAQADIAPNFTGFAAAYARPSDGGPTFTNGTNWGNDHTWATVQFAWDPINPVWRDIFLHENNHVVEWMLEYGAYPEHRNADDPWWLATYPGYDEASPGFDDLNVLTMFWARPKTFYDYLPGTWGELRTRTPMHVVETSCPGEGTLQMRRAYCEYGVSCDSVCYIGMPCSSGCYCNAEPPRGGEGGR